MFSMSGAKGCPLLATIMNYRQCDLEKDCGRYTLRETAWIPEQFAKKGKVLQFRDRNDALTELWDNGWVVVHAYTSKSVDYVLKHERDWREMFTAE